MGDPLSMNKIQCTRCGADINADMSLHHCPLNSTVKRGEDEESIPSPVNRPMGCMERVPVDVMRDIRRKSDEYRSMARKLYADVTVMTTRAEQLEKTGIELRDLADAWKKMFPDTQDCI